MIKIHREGFKIILIVTICVVLLNAVLYLYYPKNLIYLTLSFLSISFCLFIISFFRNPSRLIPEEDRAIIAAADGKVVVIEAVHEDEYFKDKRLQVSIFMSPANVHVNRSPISGLVKFFKYHPGKYLVAWDPKSSSSNERTSLVIQNEEHEILVRQIAGKLARRIVYYIEEGDDIEQGEEFGFIKFGSRIDLFLPIDVELKVKIGEKVRGGETIIGCFSK
ncbi:MAG: phosphatidylserine decarboxylase family protein [Chitinophagales bacterium]|nr:phosphatidylserine decarboxylase family protein [Chitinophagales bacterium]